MYAVITTVIAIALLFLSRKAPAFSEWYARRIFPVFPLSLGRLASTVPFSLFEIILLSAGASLPAILIGKIIAKLVRRRRRGSGLREEVRATGAVSRFFRRLCCLCSTALLFFTLTCGINYNRETFATQTGIEVRESSIGELRQLYRLLINRIGVQADELNDGKEVNQTAISAMKELSASYAGFIGYYPEAKPVFFSEWLSRCQLCGFYSCLTMEANYNREMPAINIPFTICHELAHISGFAREDEADFIGYLACSQSTDPYFQYSGTSRALRLTLSALAISSIEEDEYQKLASYIPEWAWEDFREDSLYWRQYKGKIAEIYYSANDAFLKANHQEDGMQSYGRMLDLLLAYYRENGELDSYSAAPEPVLADIDVSAVRLHSPHVVLADRETGIILYAKDSDAIAEPASVTKILTAITAIELIGDLDDRVAMTTKDFTDLYRRGASLSGFDVGEEVSYRDLLYTLMLISGCDSAYALANNLCGSLPAFAEKMNEKVAELGLTGSHFVDPSGLTAENHYSTTEDTVAILDYALENPVFRKLFETKTYQIQPTNRKPEGAEINNSFFSRLDRDFEGGYLENGAFLLGGKTGFTNAAGLCLAAVGTFEGREYIAVIFGGPGDNRTPQYNFMDAMTLYGAMGKPVFTDRH